MAALPEYQWLVVVGAFAAFIFGFGTGANDVANAFGTSVGSKTLTLRQAVTIAALFEFVGALVLGRVSTSVIAGGIADISAFYREPEIYAYGMICALIVGGFWQILASYLELNVSATHSIIAGIMGFALVYAGSDGVLWSEHDSGSFPPVKGVVPIVISWFFAPVLSAFAAALVFWICRTLVLRRANAYNLSFWLLPVAVLITTWINMYFIFTKGLKKTLTKNDNNDWSDSKAAWISAVIAVGLALVTCAVLPFLKRRIDSRFAAEGAAAEAREGAAAGGEKTVDEIKDAKQEDSEAEVDSSWFKQARAYVTHGINVDVHAAVDESETLTAMHDRAEVFDAKTERTFSYLQVFSACCVIFAHGAGEVGYMAGPLTTIWDVYRNGTLTSKVTPPEWIIVIGASGLVVGLWTYGYNVTRAVAVKIAKLSPARGFSAELATALVITVCAQYGLPNSSSQVITGAIVGVGLLEGTAGVNWLFFARQFASWVFTIVIVIACVAALFSQGVYAPSIPQGRDIVFYEDRVQSLTASLYGTVNSTLLEYQAPALDNQVPSLSPERWAELNATVATAAKANKALIDNKKAGTTDPEELVSTLYSALAFVQPLTINTLGQVNVFADALVCNSNSSESLQAALQGAATDPCPAFELVPSDAEELLG